MKEVVRNSDGVFIWQLRLSGDGRGSNHDKQVDESTKCLPPLFQLQGPPGSVRGTAGEFDADSGELRWTAGTMVYFVWMTINSNNIGQQHERDSMRIYRFT